MEATRNDSDQNDYSGLLWVDRYRPTCFEECLVHTELNRRLQRLAQTPKRLPHLFFYGPAGGGKRTRIRLLLRMLFGVAIDHSHVEHRLARVGEPARTIEYTTVSSAYHIEMNPSDVGYNDRLLVQAVIKEIAASKPLAVRVEPAADSAESKETELDRPPFKVLVLYEVDRLTREAQQALRRTMEKYAQTCRLILVAESATRVLEPLRSRCLGIRVPAPTEVEMRSVLNQVWIRVGSSERANVEALFDRIIQASEGNLRAALLSLEASHWASKSEGKGPMVFEPDWRIVCHEIVDQIRKEQSPASLLQVRSKFYDLLTHCVPADVIFVSVLKRLLAFVPKKLALQLCYWAAAYEYRARLGTKAILHLEAFAAKCMALLRSTQSGV
jgi:replication factor C subunit 3/5